MGFESAAKIIEAELRPNETLLWAGQPRWGWYFLKSDLFVLPAALSCCLTAIGFEYHALRLNLDFVAKLWPIFYGFIGIYLVGARLVDAYWVRSRVFYGVTNQRVLVVQTINKKQVNDRALSELPTVKLIEERQDYGTITFQIYNLQPRIESQEQTTTDSGPALRRFPMLRAFITSFRRPKPPYSKVW